MEIIFDPTGAEIPSWRFTGYLHQTRDLSPENVKRAVIYGSTMLHSVLKNSAQKD